MILVDYRRGSAEIAHLLSSPNVVCELEYGDFVISGNGPNGQVNIGVERKRIMDLLQSITTGRLSGHQLVGMTNSYDWAYLLVEGVWRADKDTGILQRMNVKGKWIYASQGSRRFMARDIFHFLSTLQVMCNIVVAHTSSHWETAIWLDSLHSWWSKPWDKHRGHLQFHRPVQHAHLSKPNLVTRIANQLDGIGWDKARKIGAEFSTLEDLLDASNADLMGIPGIGEKLAESVMRQLRCEKP